ncbi:glucuronide transporter [Paraoerskovia sediminicola]|uniref:Glucuronide transporter n=1 Tax=Paraoerskovia sediminicola TaxID=1138587 RepID=A0ABM8G2U2_9CELL|nr:glucuronide transporter [Paraoerskovia sediminicola]BDZ42331.1 glucuronide transporter [Paraoerskovia sediminicola]
MTSNVAVPPQTGASPAAPAAAPRLKKRQLFGYASGDAANNLAFSMTSMFLLLYYTDVVGISAAAVGTLFLVMRIIDAFTDVWAGSVVDRTMTRWGKFRPFFLWGALPLLLLSVATFTVPGGLGDTGSLVYAYVTYGLLGLAYTFVNIPYGSLASAITQDSKERAKLATWRTLGTGVTILMLSLVVAPQINDAENLQRALTTITAAFVVVGFALYMFLFSTAKENVVRDVAHVPFRQSIKNLKGNRPLYMLCGSAVSFLTGMIALQGLQAYYARDVMGDANYYIVLSLLSIGMMFVVAPLVPRLVGRFGKRGVYVGGGSLSVLGGLVIAFSPASATALIFAGFVVYGAGLMVVNTVMWALEADTVEYGEWKNGVRTEGTTYAVFSFTRKVGQAFGGAVAAFGLTYVGYVSGADSQTAETIDGIQRIAGLLPAVCVAIGVLIMLRYPLTDARFKEITAEIAARREARAAEAVQGDTTD